MKTEIFSLALPAFLSCWLAQAADIAAESKRANEFFDKCVMKPWRVIRSTNRFMESKRTTINWKICRTKRRPRTLRHCRINSRRFTASSSWNHSMPRRS